MEYPTSCNSTVVDTSVASILNAATTRWLTVEEIITLLPNTQNDEIECGPSLPSQIAPPSKPPTSGTVLHYNRFAVRNYKKDGHDWIRKRSNPAKIREDHVKLRYNGVYRVGGNYVHSDEIDTLHRRVYRLIKTDEEKAMSDTKEEYVLVHYLDTEEAAKISMKETIAPQPSSSSTTAGTKRIKSNDDIASPYSSHEQYQAAPRIKKLRTDTGSYKYGINTFHRGSTASAYTQQQDPHPPMYGAPCTHANHHGSSAPSYLPTMMQASFPSVITPPIPTKEVAALDSVSFDVLCKAIDDNNSGLFDAANFYCQV